MPCQYINFDFDINVNNIYNLKVNISKKGKDLYRFVTKMDEWMEYSEIENLENTVDIIVSQTSKIMKRVV